METLFRTGFVFQNSANALPYYNISTPLAKNIFFPETEIPVNEVSLQMHLGTGKMQNFHC